MRKEMNPKSEPSQYSFFARGRTASLLNFVILLALTAAGLVYFSAHSSAQKDQGFDRQISANSQRMFEEGKQIFRFDTFGDETFWTDKLKLHQAIQGSKLGGVGTGVSPKTALSVGLKVDMDALPADLVEKIKKGEVNLDDPATTLALIKLDAGPGGERNIHSEWQVEECGPDLRRLPLNR